MAKRVILGTFITLLVLAVLGGVGAVSYGFGMRQGLAQTQITAVASGIQVTPPQLRWQNRQGLPNRNDPRVFTRSFTARPFGATAHRLSPFKLFNPFSAIFRFVIPLLVITLLVVLIIRLLGPKPFWFGGAGHDKMMFVRGGPGGAGPQPFTMPLGDVPPHFVEWHEQMHKKDESPTPPDEAKAS